MALMGLAYTSCSSEPEFNDIETIVTEEGQFRYDSEGVWDLNNRNSFLNIDDYEFSHSVDKDGYIYGFTPSKVSDTSKHTPLYTFPYASASGGGVTGKGSQYLVGYWAEFLEGPDCTFNNRTCRIYDEDGFPFMPQSVMVCNTTYMMYAATEGTDFSPKFQLGDYVILVAHGVHVDGTESQSTFYLVNIESENVEEGVLMAWDKFDLSGMGACMGLYFTMDASPRLKSEWGLDVPTYFCIDQLVVKE